MVIPKGLYGMVNLPLRARASGSDSGRNALAATTASRPGSPSTASPGSPSAALDLAQALMAGGSRILQLRMKAASASAMLRTLEELRPQVRRRPGVKLLVNDRLDVALSAGADGVHLGQSDLPLRVARLLCPPGFLIGVSTHNEAQAEAAIEGGADYIAFGPIYATASKDNPDPVIGVDRLHALCAASPIPVVAIGGISLERVPEIVDAGAHAAAIIVAVNHASDPQNAAAFVTRAFNGVDPEPR